MKLGIIGGGTVGRATARCFLEHIEEVRVYDVMRERRTHNVNDVLECDLVFVCLPTPQKTGSLECDLSAVEEFFRAVCACNEVLYVLRSTVPVGTTSRLAKQYRLPNLVHSPEFLTARCAITDAMTPARNIVGYPDFVPTPENTAVNPLRDLYASRFPGVPTFEMLSDESEVVKLGLNSFFAVKVAYFNELRDFCDARGLNWERVRAGILSDGRIAHAHTQVPGPDGRYGFGGTCLPKDLANLIDCIEMAAGVAAPVMRAVLERNKGDRR